MHACMSCFSCSGKAFQQCHALVDAPKKSSKMDADDWKLCTQFFLHTILHVNIPVPDAWGFAGMHRMQKEAAKMCKICMKPSLAVAWCFCHAYMERKNHTSMHANIHACFRPGWLKLSSCIPSTQEQNWRRCFCRVGVTLTWSSWMWRNGLKRKRLQLTLRAGSPKSSFVKSTSGMRWGHSLNQLMLTHEHMHVLQAFLLCSHTYIYIYIYIYMQIIFMLLSIERLYW